MWSHEGQTTSDRWSKVVWAIGSSHLSERMLIHNVGSDTQKVTDRKLKSETGTTSMFFSFNFVRVSGVEPEVEVKGRVNAPVNSLWTEMLLNLGWPAGRIGPMTLHINNHKPGGQTRSESSDKVSWWRQKAAAGWRQRQLTQSARLIFFSNSKKQTHKTTSEMLKPRRKTPNQLLCVFLCRLQPIRHRDLKMLQDLFSCRVLGRCRINRTEIKEEAGHKSESGISLEEETLNSERNSQTQISQLLRTAHWDSFSFSWSGR